MISLHMQTYVWLQGCTFNTIHALLLDYWFDQEDWHMVASKKSPAMRHFSPVTEVHSKAINYCLYIHICIYMYLIYIYIYTIYISIYVYMLLYLYISQTHICIYMHVCVTHMHTGIHTYIYIHTYIHMYIHTYIYLYICIWSETPFRIDNYRQRVIC